MAVINTNMLSNMVRFSLDRTQKEIAEDQLRLSTGKKNPRAENDAAAFSIEAKLRSRIAGLNQAELNVSDAKSMIDIMEASLQKIADILFEVKKYIIQAANGTYGDDEREYIRSSINGLAGEINAIIDQTVYNGQSLLDQGDSATFQTGEQTNQNLSYSIDLDLRAQDVQVEEVTTLGVLTSSSTITAATLLNDLDQYDGLQGQDSFDIVLTQGDGTQTTVTVTDSGQKGTVSTLTINDAISAINGTGIFTASFDTADEAIIVRESVVTIGNALAVSFNNFVEFTSLDGATGSMPFSFDSSTGDLVTSLTSSGAIGAGTNFNSLDQFSDVEGNDQLVLDLTNRSGATQQVTFTFAGGEGNATTSTLGDLRDAINTQVGANFTASIVGGQLRVSEDVLPQNSLNTSSSFIENSTDTGAASVSNTSLSQTRRTIRQNTANGITGVTRLDDGVFGIGTGFNGGDSFQISLTDNSGAVQNVTYTFASANDTYQDLANFITSNTNFTATISGGELLIQQDNLIAGNSLNMNYGSYVGGGTLNNPGAVSINDTILTDTGSFGGGAYTTTTTLNSLSTFTNVQSGDTLVIRLTDNLGAAQTVNFTFAGPTDGDSTSTVNDLISAINAQTTLSASYNASLSRLVVEDPSNLGAGISMSISNTDYTESPRPTNGSINLSFSYSANAMQSNLLQTGGSNVSTATQLNAIDGWGTLEGDDIIRINLSTRAGAISSVDFTLNDVGAGVSSILTVGDLVNFIDSQSIGAVNFQATLNSGRIEIEEENPPQVGGFGSSALYSENNLDDTPKSFTDIDFEINEFLGLANDTGLVIGLGILDFNSGTTLTQSTSQKLIQNIDDSIDRIATQINEFGVIQNQLTLREQSTRSQSIANETVRSRLADVDYAKANAELIKKQIIQQTQIAALSQSNLAAASVLGLLFN